MQTTLLFLRILFGILFCFAGIMHIIRPSFFKNFIPDFLPKLAINYIFGFWLIAGLILFLIWANKKRKSTLNNFAQNSILKKLTLSLPELISKSIQESDVDIRSHLYPNIVICGSSSQFPGFEERLEKELKKDGTFDQFKERMKIELKNIGSEINDFDINIINSGKYSTWKGGAILANLENFKKMWVIPSEYYD